MSVAAMKALCRPSIEYFLNELGVLLREREHVAAVLAELQAGPWPEVRRLLGELHRSLDAA